MKFAVVLIILSCSCVTPATSQQSLANKGTTPGKNTTAKPLDKKPPPTKSSDMPSPCLDTVNLVKEMNKFRNAQAGVTRFHLHLIADKGASKKFASCKDCTSVEARCTVAKYVNIMVEYADFGNIAQEWDAAAKKVGEDFLQTIYSEGHAVTDNKVPGWVRLLYAEAEEISCAKVEKPYFPPPSTEDSSHRGQVQAAKGNITPSISHGDYPSKFLRCLIAPETNDPLFSNKKCGKHFDKTYKNLCIKHKKGNGTERPRTLPTSRTETEPKETKSTKTTTPPASTRKRTEEYIPAATEPPHAALNKTHPEGGHKVGAHKGNKTRPGAEAAHADKRQNRNEMAPKTSWAIRLEFNFILFALSVLLLFFVN